MLAKEGFFLEASEFFLEGGVGSFGEEIATRRLGLNWALSWEEKKGFTLARGEILIKQKRSVHRLGRWCWFGGSAASSQLPCISGSHNLCDPSESRIITCSYGVVFTLVESMYYGCDEQNYGVDIGSGPKVAKGVESSSMVVESMFKMLDD
ncbi:hypothetical protein VNO77_23045 [Canavalia gladiata]|uniref:Uncharacterized protein n=1 Tax=Canavalia gladiata TaxID=3824 RepID=A0AAN9Q8K0_CANGL